MKFVGGVGTDSKIADCVVVISGFSFIGGNSIGSEDWVRRSLIGGKVDFVLPGIRAELSQLVNSLQTLRCFFDILSNYTLVSYSDYCSLASSKSSILRLKSIFFILNFKDNLLARISPFIIKPAKWEI